VTTRRSTAGSSIRGVLIALSISLAFVASACSSSAPSAPSASVDAAADSVVESAGQGTESVAGVSDPSSLLPGALPKPSSQIINTPEGLVTSAAPTPTIAPGYSPYEPGTTVVGYLLEGEDAVDVFASATDTVPSQKVARINGRTLPFVVLGNTPDRLYAQLPVQPNGSLGWIEKSKLELRRNDFRIEVRLSSYELVLFEKNREVKKILIGVGSDETPTPDGTYYTLYTGKPKTEGTVYGAFVIGLSGFSEVLEEFRGNEPRLGLHGTNAPGKLGSEVSAGCIRMADADISFLVERLPLGTPVKVLA
jgi:lipoprotein-anchoring transpeptidase ErfK/SrfK